MHDARCGPGRLIGWALSGILLAGLPIEMAALAAMTQRKGHFGWGEGLQSVNLGFGFCLTVSVGRVAAPVESSILQFTLPMSVGCTAHEIHGRVRYGRSLN